MKILIVEDDKDVGQTLSYVVESFGHAPFLVSTVKHAMEALTPVNPDLIFLDLLLGGDLATPFIEVAKTMLGPKAHIVVLSAMKGAAEIAQTSGVDFLSKPFTLEELEEKLNQCPAHLCNANKLNLDQMRRKASNQD